MVLLFMIHFIFSVQGTKNAPRRIVSRANHFAVPPCFEPLCGSSAAPTIWGARRDNGRHPLQPNKKHSPKGNRNSSVQSSEMYFAAPPDLSHRPRPLWKTGERVLLLIFAFISYIISVFAVFVKRKFFFSRSEAFLQCTWHRVDFMLYLVCRYLHLSLRRLSWKKSLPCY